MFCFVFSKQNRETFQTFTGSIRGKDLDQRVQLEYAVGGLRGARAARECAFLHVNQRTSEQSKSGSNPVTSVEVAPTVQA